MNRSITLNLVVLSVLFAGCSSDDPSPGGTVADAGIAEIDAGAEASDAGRSETADSGSTPDAGDPPSDPFPDGLSCSTIALCTSYEADPSRVPFPEVPGGALRDGLYRAVQGTNIPYGLAIWNGHYALIFENLTVSYGDCEVVGDVMRTTRHTACSSNGEVNDPALLLEQETFFATDGTELITYSGCDSMDPNVCGSPTRLA